MFSLTPLKFRIINLRFFFFVCVEETISQVEQQKSVELVKGKTLSNCFTNTDLCNATTRGDSQAPGEGVIAYKSYLM